MSDPLEKRYEDAAVNRQYHLSEAMIHFKSYKWAIIDSVALALTDEEVAAFCKIVAALNAASGEA